MAASKNIYFASDFHLGIPDEKSSSERELRIVRWLDMIKEDAFAIFLVGDIFDFWFEYRTVIPKGYIRLLGKLSELKDRGIEIGFFTGNHDMWMFGYFEKELGIPVYKEPVEREYSGKKFLIGHGDGLGPGDHGYKFLKGVFANKLCQWMFRWLHPDIGMRLGIFWSRQSRYSNGDPAEQFEGENKERLIIYAKKRLEKHHFDYFIFGHRHTPIVVDIAENSKYVNLGDWITYFSYAVFDGRQLELKYFDKN